MPRTAAAYRAAVVASQPTLYWPLDDASGPVSDASGNGHHGQVTPTGLTYQVPGIYDEPSGALRFVYVQQARVTIADLAINSGPLTFEHWGRIDPAVPTAGNGWHATLCNEAATVFHRYLISNNLMRWWSTTPTFNPTPASGINAGSWAHYAYVQAGLQNIIYVNAAPLYTSAVTSVPPEAFTRLVVGCRWDTGAPSYHWNGDLAHIALYPRALTAQEIATHYNASTPAILTNALPVGTAGQPYETQLEAEGGVGTLTWSIADGVLPPGLTLDPVTGVISGTPEA